MKDFPHLNVFLQKHKLALHNKSRDIRITIEEMNDLVHDLHSLMSTVSTQLQDQTELKTLLKDLLHELKELNSGEADGGTF